MRRYSGLTRRKGEIEQGSRASPSIYGIGTSEEKRRTARISKKDIKVQQEKGKYLNEGKNSNFDTISNDEIVSIQKGILTILTEST